MLVFYILVTSIIVYLIQSQKIFDYIFHIEFLKAMRKCDICLGFWVFFTLYPLFRVNIFQGLVEYNHIQEVFLAIISSMILALVAHYLKIGIRSEHQTVIING